MDTLGIFVAVFLHRGGAYTHAIHNRASVPGALGQQLRYAVFRLPVLCLFAGARRRHCTCRVASPAACGLFPLRVCQ